MVVEGEDPGRGKVREWIVLCARKESADRRNRGVNENVTRDREYEQWTFYSMWRNVNRIGMRVFMGGWEGERILRQPFRR